MAKDDIEFGEIDLDDDLDLDGLDPGSGESSDTGGDRSPVNKLKDGFLGSVKDLSTDTSFLKKAVLDSLPKEYSQTAEGVERTLDQGKSLYDTTTAEASKSAREARRLGRRLLPRVKKHLPNTVGDQVEKYLEDKKRDDDRERSKTKDRPLSVDEKIGMGIEDVFQANMERDQENKEQDRARDLLRDSLETKRFDDQMEAQTAMVDRLNRLVSFQDSIQSRYIKKQVELQYRQLAVQHDLLEHTKAHSADSIDALKSITKNTALPEYRKLELTEATGERFRDSLVESAAEKADKYTSRFRENLFNKLETTVKGFGQDFRGGLDMVSGVVPDEDEEGMGPGATQTAGMMAGMMAGNLARDHITPFIRRKTSKIDAVDKGAQNLGYATEGAGERLREWVETNDYSKREAPEEALDDEGRVIGHYDENGNVVETTKLERVRNAATRSFANIGLGAANFVRSSAPGENEDYGQYNAVEEGAGQAVFNVETRKSINEVIPGYLSRIHHELAIMRTGDDSIERVLYNPNTQSFSSYSAVKESVRDLVDPKGDREKVEKRLNEFVSTLETMGEGELSPLARKELKAHATALAERGYGFFGEEYLTGKRSVSADEDVDKEVKDLLRNALGDEGSAGSNKDRYRKLASELRNVRTQLPNYQQSIREQSSIGLREILRDLDYVDDSSGSPGPGSPRGSDTLNPRGNPPKGGGPGSSSSYSPWSEDHEENQTVDENTAGVSDDTASGGGDNSLLRRGSSRIRSIGSKLRNTDVRASLKRGHEQAKEGYGKVRDSLKASVDSARKNETYQKALGSVRENESYQKTSDAVRHAGAEVKGRVNDLTQTEAYQKTRSYLSDGKDAVLQSTPYTYMDEQARKGYESASEFARRARHSVTDKKTYTDLGERAKGAGEQARLKVNEIVDRGVDGNVDLVRNKGVDLRTNVESGAKDAKQWAGDKLDKARDAVDERLEQVQQSDRYKAVQKGAEDQFARVKGSGSYQKVNDAVGRTHAAVRGKVNDLTQTETYQTTAKGVSAGRDKAEDFYRKHIEGLGKKFTEAYRASTKDLNERYTQWMEREKTHREEMEERFNKRLSQFSEQMGGFAQSVKESLTRKEEQNAKVQEAAIETEGTETSADTPETPISGTRTQGRYDTVVGQEGVVEAIEAQTNTLTESLQALDQTERLDTTNELLAGIAEQLSSVGSGGDGDGKETLGRKASRKIGGGVSKFLGGTLSFYGSTLKGLGKGVGGLSGGILGGLGKRAKSILTPSAKGKRSLHRDVYAKGYPEPVLYGSKMRLGHYTDSVTGETIETIDDVENPVVDEDGQYVVTSEQIGAGLYVRDESGALTSLAKATGRGIAGMYSSAIKNLYARPLGFAFKMANKLGGAVFGEASRRIRGIKDVYVVGETEPRMLGSLMTKNNYVSKRTGKPIKKPTQIDGPVVDRDGNTVLRLEDIHKGLVDKNGKPFKSVVARAFDLAGKVIGGGIGLAASAARASWTTTASVVKAGADLVGGAGKALGGSRAKPSKKDRKKDQEYQERHLSLLKDIYSLLDRRMAKPEKDIYDTDGDGFRDNSWRDQFDERRKEDKEEKPKNKSLIDQLKGLAGGAGIGSLFGGGDDEEESDDDTYIGGYNGGDDDKKEEKRRKKEQKAKKKRRLKQYRERNGRAPRGRWGRVGRMMRRAPGKAGLARGALTVGRGALSLGATAMTGMSLAGTGTAIAGAASTAATAAGGILAGIGSVLASPVVIGAGIVAGVAVGGYFLYKHLSAVKPGLAGGLRFVQYGVDVEAEEQDMLKPVRWLEKELKDKVTFSGKQGRLKLDDEQTKELMEGFGIDPEENPERARKWLSWFSNRFRPVYLRHRKALKEMDFSGDMDDIDDSLDKKQKLAYLKAVDFGEQQGREIFSYRTSPFEEYDLQTEYRHVKAYIDEAREKLEGDDSDTKKSRPMTMRGGSFSLKKDEDEEEKDNKPSKEKSATRKAGTAAAGGVVASEFTKQAMNLDKGTAAREPGSKPQDYVTKIESGNVVRSAVPATIAAANDPSKPTPTQDGEQADGTVNNDRMPVTEATMPRVVAGKPYRQGELEDAQAQAKARRTQEQARNESLEVQRKSAKQEADAIEARNNRINSTLGRDMSNMLQVLRNSHRTHVSIDRTLKDIYRVVDETKEKEDDRDQQKEDKGWFNFGGNDAIFENASEMNPQGVVNVSKKR